MTRFISSALVTIMLTLLVSSVVSAAQTESVVSEYTTYFAASNTNRTTNIKLASAAINGYVVNPGAVFSFNGVVGPRTAAKGYKEAIIFDTTAPNGETMGLGGGICQVSSTIYNCVLKAKDLGVVERHPHSKPVTYVPSGKDATVSYGSQDFRFRNNRKLPLKISTSVGGGALTIRFSELVEGGSSTPVQTAKPTPTPTPEPTYKPTKVKLIDENDETTMYNDAYIMVKSGRTIVAVRFFEKLGYQVTWNGKTKVASLKNGSNMIDIPVGSTKVWMNYKEYTIDEAARMIGDKVYVPLRFVAEATNMNVSYDNTNKYSVIAAKPESKIRQINVELAVNGKTYYFDDAFVVKKTARTLIPARLCENLGFKVEWDQANKIVKLNNGDTIIDIPIGSSTVWMNYNKYDVDEPARVVGGKAYVPVRFIATALGLNLTYNDSQGRLYLSK